MTELQGADVKLFFSCKVLQELGIHMSYMPYINSFRVNIAFLVLVSV